MSEWYPVLILKALSWLLMARFTPYSGAVVAQMWPRGREGKVAMLVSRPGMYSYFASARIALHQSNRVQGQTPGGHQLEPRRPTCTEESDSISVGHGFGERLDEFQHRFQGMGIAEVKIARQSPWQNPFAERLWARFASAWTM